MCPLSGHSLPVSERRLVLEVGCCGCTECFTVSRGGFLHIRRGRLGVELICCSSDGPSPAGSGYLRRLPRA